MTVAHSPGSARRGHGTGHFIAERVSSIVLLFLVPWFLISVALLDGTYATTRAWLASPFNAIGLGVLVLVGLYHARLGIQVIVDDYIGEAQTRSILLGVTTFVAASAAAVSAYALYSISFGG